MSSTKKAVIVTAAAVGGAIAIAAIALSLIDKMGGTPIIIKGSSAKDHYLTISFYESPTGSGDTQKVAGGFDYVKISDSTGHCVVYDCAGLFCWSNEIQLTTESTAGASRVDVNDTLFDGLETTFDRAKFDGDPPANPKDFKSQDFCVIKDLVFSTKSGKPTCKDKNGKIDCPERWTYLEDLEISINPESPSCQ